MDVIEQSLEFTAPTQINLRIDASVLQHFSSNVQRRWWAPEAGGQLFAKIDGDRWNITLATGPRPSDFRSRFGFRANRQAERAEINRFFQDGLHYVGDWHTHPENVPHPSQADIRSISEIVDKSTHSLPGFTMVIVGRAPIPQGLWISFHGIEGSYSSLAPKQSSH